MPGPSLSDGEQLEPTGKSAPDQTQSLVVRPLEEALVELYRSPAQQLQRGGQQTPTAAHQPEQPEQRQPSRQEVIAKLNQLRLHPDVREEWRARWQVMSAEEREVAVDTDA